MTVSHTTKHNCRRVRGLLIKKKGFQKAYFRHWELFKWNKITKKNIFDHNWDQTRKYPLPLRGEKVSLCPAVLLLARYPLLLLIFSLTFPVLHQVEKSDCCTVHCKNAAFTVMFFSFSPRKLQPILFLYNLTLWFGAQLAGGLCLQQKLQVREILSFNFFFPQLHQCNSEQTPLPAGPKVWSPPFTK